MHRKSILPILSFFILFFPFQLQAQSKTDSLTRLINREKDQTKKHRLYLERAITYPRNEIEKAYGDVETATNYFENKADLERLADCRLALADVYYKDKKRKESLQMDSIVLKISDSIGYKKGKAHALGNIARELYSMGRYHQMDSCLEQAITLSEKLKPAEPDFLAKLYNRMGVIKSIKHEFGKSFDYIEKAIELALKQNNKTILSLAYSNRAINYNRISKYELAVKNYLKAIDIAEKLKDPVLSLRFYNNIAITFRHLKEYDKAIFYFKKSIALSRKNKAYNSLGLALMNIATVYVNQGQTEGLDTLYHQSVTNFKKADNLNNLASAYHNYGNYLLYIKRYGASEKNLKTALKLRKQYSSDAMVLSTLSVLGKLMLKQGKLKDAGLYLNQAVHILQDTKSKKSIKLSRELYLYLKELSLAKKDYQKAYAYQQKEMDYLEQIFDESEKVNALKLQTEYDLEKRDTQIETERKLHRHKQVFMLSIGGGILLILMLFLFILLQRRKRAKERYKAELLQLEQRHRLNLADSLAKAEQEERKKIASKLHDETGGLLSVIKLNIDQLDENVFVAGSNAGEKLKSTKKLLSEATESIRNISHSLMPVALEKYGLKAALQDLVNAINTSGKIRIEEVLEGLEDTRSWNPQLTLTIYRMVQEAFSNIIRHAQATNVLFQVIELKNSVTIYIEDNGRGLKNDSPDADGIGLDLLKQNIEYLNGKIEINSKENQGTFVLAELPIRPKDDL